MIRIKDITVAGLPATKEDIHAIYGLMKTRLKEAFILHKSNVIDGKEIVFDFVDKDLKKTFLSSKMNKVHLKEGDSRIAKFKKNVLETPRLTEKQYEFINDLVLNKLISLGFLADISYQEFVDDTKALTQLVKGNTIVGKLPRPKTFPVEG